MLWVPAARVEQTKDPPGTAGSLPCLPGLWDWEPLMERHVPESVNISLCKHPVGGGMVSNQANLRK